MTELIWEGKYDKDGKKAEDFTKEPSIIEQKAYRDTWGKGLDSYLQWFNDTASLLNELLSESGSIYVHLDYHVSHYAKVILDEVFGPSRFLNEIIWKRTGARSGTESYNIIHDSLFFYTKSEKYTWNTQYTPYTEKYIEDFFQYEDTNGKKYRHTILTAPGTELKKLGKEADKGIKKLTK